MQKCPILVIVSLYLLLSGSAYAHNGLFAHPHTSDDTVHLFMHGLMLLPVATGIFFLTRWLFHRNRQAMASQTVVKR